MLTLDQLKKALPANVRGRATQEYVDKVNKITEDPEFAEHVRSNLISYASVMADGKFSIEEYLNAVTYVSYKVMGFSNQDAYAQTFPDRYASHVANGYSDKIISSYVSAYNKGKLVNLIFEQTMTPSWVLNHDLHQKAINRLALLMSTANSEKVQCDAAIGLATLLKRPEKAQVELNIGVNESQGMQDLKDTLAQLAQQQQQLIAAGMTTKQVVQTPIIQGTAIDITPAS